MEEWAGRNRVANQKIRGYGNIMNSNSDDSHHRFERDYFNQEWVFTVIGKGELGGKASGLARMNSILDADFPVESFPDFEISIPRTTVLRTGVFDLFMERNQLYETASSDKSDTRIAEAFQRAHFPDEFVGDLRALISKVHTPLAIRSSSLLEDAKFKPFAGVYTTKMIPNNQPDIDTRFRKLMEAIKLVYASTYFKSAKNYLKSAGYSTNDEKMAVILQDVVGDRYGDRYYPVISGVGKTYNYYPQGKARPEDGVISLALGLGRTIVDGGVCWSYSPKFPKSSPPVGKVSDLLKQSQLKFWAINMGKINHYDPVRETEFMTQAELKDAEYDNTLRSIASTYNAASDRLVPGIGTDGPRIITFAPMLLFREPPLNDLLKTLLKVCEKGLESDVEIEFAVSRNPKSGKPARLGFLQVRPMVVSGSTVEVTEEDFRSSSLLAASDATLGNAEHQVIKDIVYVKPESFETKFTKQIAQELKKINQDLTRENRPYLLIGFGRWGSSDPWLGIPVTWDQISQAKTIIESTLPSINVDFSQGSHFFHNLSSFEVSYFFMHHNGKYGIDWDWLAKQKHLTETKFTRHVRIENPILVKVDGRTRKGCIRYE